MSVIPATTTPSSRTNSLLRARVGTTKVFPYVAKSWERCLHCYGIEPDADRDTAVLGAESLQERQEQLGSLLNVAQAEMENLYEQITGSGYAVILCDADAVVLSAITDPNVKREFRQAGLWLGSIWSEDREGTNGIGTCIAEGVPVMVYRDEHFRRYNAALACSGAPIHDVHGNVMAVLDASSAHATDARPVQRHTMALVNMSANLISRCHFLDSFSDAWVLRFHSRAEFVGLLHEALLAIDEEGNVLAANDSAMIQLGISSRSKLVGQPVSSIFPFEMNTLRQRASETQGMLWPTRDIAYGRRFFAVARAPHGQNMRSMAVTQPDSSKETAAPPLREEHRYIGNDTRLQRNLNCGRQLFGRRVPLLLQGATGTGKEAFAKELHRTSAWSDRPFVAVNCAAIPESLIESELFGYTRGAFTDAAREGHIGKIQQASGGTLFLDEIGDMPLPLQTRLLRVLEEHEIVPLGGSKPIPVDLHVISASYHDLMHMLQEGRFREDLYYRLNGITLHLPTLAERTDKRELIDALLQEECGGQAVPVIDEDALNLLLEYAWPGNIRQLRNSLRTAAALCEDGTINSDLLPPEITDSRDDHAEAQAHSTPLNDAERDALLKELERMHWNISRTAESLGVSRNTLYRKIRKHGIALPG